MFSDTVDYAKAVHALHDEYARRDTGMLYSPFVIRSLTMFLHGGKFGKGAFAMIIPYSYMEH